MEKVNWELILEQRFRCCIMCNVPWRGPVDGLLHRLLHNDARYGGHDDPDEHEPHPDILGRHHKRYYPHSDQCADLQF